MTAPPGRNEMPAFSSAARIASALLAMGACDPVQNPRPLMCPPALASTDLAGTK